MPNHVTNIIIAPEHVLDFLRAYPEEGGEESLVEFNNVLPQPKGLFLGNLGEAERKDYGTNNWYDWNRANWGTKWGAYNNSRPAPTQVRFETAWAHPEPVIKALAKQFPDDVLVVRYADENFGHNVGEYSIQGEDVFDVKGVEFGTPESYELAADILYGQTLLEWRNETREDYDDEEWATWYREIDVYLGFYPTLAIESAS